jgi:CubicO group peptidase (beta-lactamase class C family)
MRKAALAAGAIVCSLLVLSLISCGAADQTQATDDSAVFDPRLQAVRNFLAEEVTDGTVPSLAIAVASGGKIVWEEAFGWADKEHEVRATPYTKYRLGSIAKPITATAVMRLVQVGLVDLDAPIERYLGELTLRYYAGTSEEVTVRRVLQHRAGLPPHDQAFYLDEEPDRRPLRETVRRYGNVMFEPGWSYIYSNLGYMLLARVVEQATGMDFPHYVRDSVFKSLGMEGAQVYVAGDELSEPTATSYYGVNDEPIPRSTSAYPGPEDVYSSAHDLLRFAMFHLGDRLPDQDRILTDQMIDEMQRQEPPSNTQYGLGWSFDIDELGFRSIYHGGQTTGVSNFMVLVPTEDVAIVILTNSDYAASRLLHIQGAIRAVLIPGYDGRDLWPLPTEQARAVETDTTAAQSPDAAVPQRFPEEMLGKWLGRIVAYDREIAVSLDLSRDGGATIKLTGQEELPVDFSVLSSGFLLGTFPGSIPTPDMARYDGWIRLAVRYTGDTLSGQATAVGWREDRQTHTEQSAWIELRRQ